MGWAHDLRSAVRVLMRTPASSSVVVVVCACSLALNMAVVVLAQLAWQPLPYPLGEQLIAVESIGSPGRGLDVPDELYFAMRDSKVGGAVDAVGAYTLGAMTLMTERGERMQAAVAAVTADIPALLQDSTGASSPEWAALQRSADEQPSIVLAGEFWRRRFQGDSGLIGRSLRINGRGYRVAGVLSQSFKFPSSPQPDVYMALTLRQGGRISRYVRVIARMAAGHDVSSTASRLHVMARSIDSPRGEMVSASEGRLAVRSLAHVLKGRVESMAWYAMGSAACLLLLLCANLSSLAATRSFERERDYRTRIALGATRADVTRLRACEALVLTGSALAVALLVSPVLVHALRLAAPSGPLGELRDSWSLRLAVGACSSLLFTAACVVRPVRLEPVARRRRVSERWTVGSQAAVALVCVAVCLVWAREFAWWRSDPVGVATGLVTFKVPMMAAGLNDDQRRTRAAEVLGDVTHVANIAGAAGTTTGPLSGATFEFNIAVEGMPAPPEGTPLVQTDLVSEDYFDVVGAPMLAGRPFARADDASGAKTAVVNRAFVQARLVGVDPVGRRISLGGRPSDADVEIVGVVADIADGEVGAAPKSHVYRPFSQARPQMTWHTLVVVARGRGDGEAALSSLRMWFATVAKSTFVYDLTSVDTQIEAFVAPRRQRLVLLLAIGVAALLLPALGIYGATLQMLIRRRRDNAIRLAMGSSMGQLRVLAVKDLVTPVVVGMTIGAMTVLVTVSAWAPPSGLGTLSISESIGAAAVGVGLAALGAACGPLFGRRGAVASLVTELHRAE